MAFPATRMRRLRRTGLLRGLVRETELTPSHLVQPYFVQLGTDSRTSIESMPGIDRLSISHLVEEAGRAQQAGVPSVLLFGIPAEKDERGSGAYDDEGVVQLAVRALKDAYPELVVITDVCLCEYTSHGHCGVVRDDGEVDNEKGRVVIFAAGTGNPFFTTDTAAALRALEIHAEAILMAKNGVKGVYTADPRTHADATFIERISHREAIEQQLAVMDSTALSLCMDNNLPIHVFNLDDERNIERIVSGERVGTLVTNE
jgi:hypothetical protein